ncbi:UNVERIFIED_CONTAM: Tyrosine-protein phosphatase non-receptor type 3 [Gekko kuhli]
MDEVALEVPWRNSKQLYRKKPGLAVTYAKLPQNMDKNRYKDVLPYDITRVILKGNEDYINANYVNVSNPVIM